MKKLSLFIAAAACLALVFSCKDDETTTTKPSLSGLVLEGTVAYVAVGTTQNITINTNSLTTTGDDMPVVIGLYCQVNSAKADTLTKDIRLDPVKTFTYKVDTLGKYSVNCYAYTPDNSHYSASTNVSFQAIDPDNSITGLAGALAPGEKYLQITSGGLTWLAQNLGETGSGMPYEKCEILNTLFGRYYTYEEALTACPDGWRLPTAAEWDALGSDSGKLMADASFLGAAMWPYCKEVKITNETGFNAIPTGYIDKTEYYSSTIGLNEYALFWTADAKDDTLAYYRYIFGKDTVVKKGEGSRTSLALSVRCVK